jgi:hypothetical protein
MKLKFTKNVITREEALAICPAYVTFVDHKANCDACGAVLDNFQNPRKGQEAFTAYTGPDNITIFMRVTVTSVNHEAPGAIDGPIVRVSNGEYTWRVDGNDYAWLLPRDLPACRKAVDACLATA